MPDTEYLRQAMHAETSDLPMHLTADRIRRRARGLRARRTAVVAGACLLITAAAVPGYALHNEQADQQPAGPLSTLNSSPCLRIFLDPPSDLLSWTDTGASIKGADGQQYEVLFTGFWQMSDDAGLAVAFVDQKTDRRSILAITGAGRHSNGDFIVNGSAGTQRFQFLSKQLVLGPHRVLDLGIYSKVASRITVGSEGRSSDAQVRVSENGWTTFWAVRDAKPLPKDADTGPQEYTGPERLTITAYDRQGHTLDTVTGGFRTGQYTQNPRDNWPISVPEATHTSTEPDASTSAPTSAGAAGRDILPSICDLVSTAPASTEPSSTP